MTNFDLLPPETLAEAKNAWQRAQDKGKTQHSAHRSLGTASFLDTLNTAVEEAKKKGETGFGLECIANPETRQAFEEAFKLSERLVDYLNLSAPASEQMISAGVNFQYLAEQFECMRQEESVVPHVVLAPHGLGMKNWLAIGQKIVNDKTIPNNPLRVDNSEYGLRIEIMSRWLRNNIWRNSDQAPTSTTTPGLNTLPTYQDESYPNVKWTLRLLSGKEQPDHISVSYRWSQEQAPPIECQTLAEGLTDKFTTILAGKNPTDNYHNSLCWQPNPNANRVLFVTFDKLHSIIVVGQEEINYAKKRNGIRCPVG